MSFKCERCHKGQPARTAMTKLVIKSREVTYKNAEGEVTGKGRQIVEEIAVCPKCIANDKQSKEQKV